MSQFNYLQKKYTEFEYPNNNLNNNTSEPIIVKKKKFKKIFCNNCNESGHVIKQCPREITSYGFIAFKIVNNKEEELYDKNSKMEEILSHVKTVGSNDSYPKIKFLMIQRKNTMSFTDFVRGKYDNNTLFFE